MAAIEDLTTATSPPLRRNRTTTYSVRTTDRTRALGQTQTGRLPCLSRGGKRDPRSRFRYGTTVTMTRQLWVESAHGRGARRQIGLASAARNVRPAPTDRKVAVTWSLLVSCSVLMITAGTDDAGPLMSLPTGDQLRSTKMVVPTCASKTPPVSRSVSVTEPGGRTTVVGVGIGVGVWLGDGVRRTSCVTAPGFGSVLESAGRPSAPDAVGAPQPSVRVAAAAAAIRPVGQRTFAPHRGRFTTGTGYLSGIKKAQAREVRLLGLSLFPALHGSHP
jgi:hypothetical protein